MQPLLTQLLSLPGIEVEDYHDFGHKIIIEVEARTEKATCPRCGQESSHLHQNHWHLALLFRYKSTTSLVKGESTAV